MAPGQALISETATAVADEILDDEMVPEAAVVAVENLKMVPEGLSSRNAAVAAVENHHDQIVHEAATGVVENLKMAPEGLSSRTAVAVEVENLDQMPHEAARVAVENLEIAPEDLNSRTAAAVTVENLDQMPQEAAGVAVEKLKMAPEGFSSRNAAADVENLNQMANEAATVAVENLKMAPEGLSSRTAEAAVENIDQMANEAATVAVENLSMAHEDLSSRTTAAVAVENLGQMAHEAARVAVENLEMASEDLNSRTEAAVEEAAPPCSVHDFGSLTKNKRSKRRPFVTKATEDVQLATLLLLPISRCSGGSATATSSHTTTTATTLAAINDKKQTYNCTVCNKSFSTYQALGGHKGIHRNQLTKHDNPATFAVPGNVSTLSLSKETHVCSICDKSFTTGQALGGHKRLHFQRHSGNACEGGSKRIVHDFDLNQPASPELESELEFNVDLEMKSDNHEIECPLPNKRRRLPSAVDLTLSLSQH